MFSGSNAAVNKRGPNGKKKEKQIEISDLTDEELKHFFRPEFLNRLDEIVFYKPLQKSEISKILELLIKDLEARLEDKHISLELTETAKNFIATKGYDIQFGARPLKRAIQKYLEENKGDKHE